MLSRNRSLAWRGGCWGEILHTLVKEDRWTGNKSEAALKTVGGFAAHICLCLTKFMSQLASLNKLENVTKKDKNTLF